MTRAPRGSATAPRLPTALMRSPAMTPTASSRGWRPVPSMRVPPWITRLAAGCARLRTGVAAASEQSKAPAGKDAQGFSFLCSGEGISLVERFDEAAFFQLFGQGRIYELFRLRQRSFTLKLVFDEKLNCLQRRPRAFLQGRRVVLPGSFEDFLVADLAVLGKNFFAEFLVAAVAVHGAREGAQKAQRDIALLGEK